MRIEKDLVKAQFKKIPETKSQKRKKHLKFLLHS